MAVYEIVIDVSTKIVPFLKEGSSIEMVVPDPRQRYGMIRIELKDGITPEMMGSISPIGVALRFDVGEVKQADIGPAEPRQPQRAQERVQEAQDHRRFAPAPDRQPALPHVESEYEEIKSRVGEDLGVPVQTLFGTSEGVPQSPAIRKMAQTDPVERRGAVYPPIAPSLPPVVEEQPWPQPVSNQQPQRKPQYQNPEPQRVPARQEQEPQMRPQYQDPPPPQQPKDQFTVLQEQMTWMMEQMSNMMQGGQQMGQAAPPPQRVKLPPSIMDWKELDEYLRAAGPAPEIDESKRMSRGQAKDLERYRLGKSAYVVSTKSQLFVEDIGVSFKPTIPTNLAGLPLAKVQRSNDIRRAFSQGLLKFIDADTAQYLAENADVTSVHDMGSQLPAFVGERGVDQAALNAIDVTPGGGGMPEGGASRVASRMSSHEGFEGLRMVGENQSGANMMVQDVTEYDNDEQTGLMNLNNTPVMQSSMVPDRFADEPMSQAMMASMRDGQMGGLPVRMSEAGMQSGRNGQMRPATSRTWRPTTRLDS